MAIINGTNGNDNLVGTADGDIINAGGGNDTIDGGAGADTMFGGLGDDIFVVDNALDLANEVAGEGTDTVNASVSYRLGNGQSIEVLSATGTASIDLIGNELANTINGNSGANTLDGGDEPADGGVAAVNDTLVGGTGNDTYIVRNTGDVVTEGASAGTDQIFVDFSQGGATARFGGTYSIAAVANVENLAMRDQASTVAFDLTGNTLANSIVGNNGDNNINGGAGADTMNGLGGNDTYAIDSASDVIIEAAGGGLDTANITGDFTLSAGSFVEVLNGDGGANTIVGNETVQTINGGGGDDDLNGGAGTDSLAGGLGNDILRVDVLGEAATEIAGQGNDVIVNSVSYQIAAANSIEALVAAGYTNGNAVATATSLRAIAAGTVAAEITAANAATVNTTTNAINLVGNELSQTLVGNNGANIILGANAPGGAADTMYGLGGDDTYRVYNGGDVVVEFAGGGNDTIFTSVSYTAGDNIEVLSAADQFASNNLNLNTGAGSQTIFGDQGANDLDGGAGADTLVGYSGDDDYFVTTGDVVVEEEGRGFDRVFVNSATYVLNNTSYVEQIINNTGVAASITGNELSQTIFGSAGNDTLSGGGGAADTLNGGLGNDTYGVKFGDVLVDSGGTDTAFATGNYILNNGVAIELLSAANQSSTAGQVLVGNDTAGQTVIGSAGADTIDAGGQNNDGFGSGGGGDGATDTLRGLGGNDTYRVYESGDRVEEAAGGGNDTVFSSANYGLAAGQEIETLSASSQSASYAINLGGNEFAQRLIGNNGVNVLDGGDGNDTLVGNGGADVFQFSSTLGSNNIDTIETYQPGSDVIRLSSAIFGTGIGATVEAGEVRTNTTGLAEDANDYLIYNSATGQLFYDADGNGTAFNAIQFALLQPGLNLTNADFQIGAVIAIP